MALIRVRVDPPSLVKPPYGLLDVAQVVEDSAPHWRTGVEYDTFNCHEAKVWGEWCTGTGQPAPVTITRTITTALIGVIQNGTYGLSAQANVDGGAQRQVKFSLETGTHDYFAVAPTVGTVTPIVTGLSEPINGIVTITDIATGVAINVPVRQNEDGTLETPTTPMLIAVPELGIPADCFGITTTFTAAPNTDATAAGITVSATTTATAPRDLIVYIGSHRAQITTGTPSTLNLNLATGFYKVAVRDVASWSYVTGWLYITDAFAGVLTLVQPTCPVKDIVSPPWQTLDADPFTVYAEVICKAVAFPEASAAAMSALEAGRQRAVERHYWDSLIERAQAVEGGQPVTVVRAVAALEQYIASVYNGVGTLHVSPWGIEYLAHANLLDSSRWRGRYGNAQAGELLRTWRGTPIVVGHGYPREAEPTTTATDDQFWLFITGQIVVRHSPAEVVETFNQRTNDKTAVAESTFVIIDDCPIPGVAFVQSGEVV